MTNEEALTYLYNSFQNLAFTWKKQNELQITFPYGLTKENKEITIEAIRKTNYCYLTDNGQISKLAEKSKLYQRIMNLAKYYGILLKNRAFVSPRFYLKDSLNAISNYQKFMIAVKENFNLERR